MTTLYLIRHGETVWNADGRFQGHQDTDLNDTGRAQARLVAQRLAAVKLDAIYTSDLHRSAETAEIIAGPHGLLPMADTRLREAFFGEWEGHTIHEITERWPEIMTAWRADSLRTRPPGGETLEQLQQRVGEMLDDIFRDHPDGTVAIAGHGGSVRAVIAIALGADLSIFRKIRLDNCALSVVRHQDGRYTVLHLNDTCHLASERITTTWDEAGAQWRNTADPR